MKPFPHKPILEILDYFREDPRLDKILQYRIGVLEEIITASSPDRKARKVTELNRVDEVLQGMYYFSNYGKRED